MSDQTGMGTAAFLRGAEREVRYCRLQTLADQAGVELERLPYTVKVLLENILRRHDGARVGDADVLALAHWTAASHGGGEVSFMPARVLLQDFTGVPAVVDLAALRSALARLGGDPARINPMLPVDLVIDHSVQVDVFGTRLAFRTNVEMEYERNKERYVLLRWAQRAFRNVRVVPPDTGIVHQVNLEYLASVVHVEERAGTAWAYPDTLVGTDSHTTMVNGLGVLGWGVGGIEAEAVMLGQPLYLPYPQVLGLRLVGERREGVTGTDLVLTVAELLRKHGVVGKFVEFTGPGVAQLTLPDRATLGNMSPEYGATSAICAVDDETLRYLRATGRPPEHVALVERYAKEQGLFRAAGSPEPQFSDVLQLDLSSVEPSLAGPRRPQDRVPLSRVRQNFEDAFQERLAAAVNVEQAPARFDWEGGTVNEAQEPSEPCTVCRNEGKRVSIGLADGEVEIGDGSVVIAAITSCTNTSNPAVMIGAGLLARKAVELGLHSKPWVKTSLAPGSRVVSDYLRNAGLTPYLEGLGFHLVGYGCTTCIGNSGPLPKAVADAIQNHKLAVAAVLSGNRNFEGRIHSLVRASYLASPPLVVAFALAGTLNIDLTREPVGRDSNGQPVYLHDIWPRDAEIQEVLDSQLRSDLFLSSYAHVMDGDQHWRSLPAPDSELFSWQEDSTYVQEPPFFADFTHQPPPLHDIRGARVLALLGDSITTDHISPAGAIPLDSPAGAYLQEQGVQPADFNSYGARRGNDRVMVRGTFGNVRLRNELAPGREGDWTRHLPDGEEMRIFDASRRYLGEGTPLLIIAGKEYGSGSSRDWAAKGTQLLGVTAVLAESFERIHRSNLVDMGVLPLEFPPGETRHTWGLSGQETYDILGLQQLQPHGEVTIRTVDHGAERQFTAGARVDSKVECDYLRHGGILPLVLREMLEQQSPAVETR